MKPHFAFLCMALGLVLIPQVQANGLIIVDDPVDLPRVLPPIPPFHPLPPSPIHRLMPLELQRQQVEVQIKDQIATTQVLQVFANNTSNRFEGTFLLPLPEHAHVQEFSMEINGERVQAELLDAAKARQIYEEIVRKSLDPALFEYAGRGLLKVRIFPIEPHSTREIRVRYTELLPNDGNVIGYTYPLDTTKYSLKPIPDFTMKVSVEASEGRLLKTIYSPSHEIEITRKDERHAVLGLETAKMAVDTDFRLYLSQRSTGGDAVDMDFLTYHENGPDEPGHFLLLVSPPAWDAKARPLPKDVIFVFDSSGSMKGEKMEQARRAMRYCVGHLNPEDRFEVIRFSTEAEPVFGNLVSADTANRKRAEDFLEGVNAIGGTAIEEALTLAMKTAATGQTESNRPQQIIFLTDGKPTLGATQDEAILQSIEKARGERSNPARIFCFGIGTALNTHLLDLIAERTRSVSDYVLPAEDIEEKVSRFFAKISDPVLTGLRVEINGAKWIRYRYPKELPDLFHGDQLVILGTYEREAKEGSVRLSGTMLGEKRDFFLATTLGGNRDNAFIAKLWATRRAGYLLDEIRLHGESAELRDEVSQLARKYGIVTPYTSYLILEDETRRDVPVPLRTQAPAPASAGQDYEDFRSRTEGVEAVGGAQAAKELKESRNEAGISTANAAIDKARGKQIELNQSRNLAGKTFFQNGSVWIDQEAQDLPTSAPRRQIKFASPEYFDLLAENPAICQWLSVGPAVQIVVDHQLIQIVN